MEAAAEAWIQPSAISAASSLALLRFLPSYQNRAATVCPLITTRLDQAVRPPGKKIVPLVWVLFGGGGCLVAKRCACERGRREGGGLRSKVYLWVVAKGAA